MADLAGPAAQPPGPLIVTCLRHADPGPAVDAATGEVRPYPPAATAAPAEWAALELALQLATAWSGRVLAVTAGPPAAEATLRQAVAAGASALRVDTEAGDGDPAELVADEQALATALATALGRDRPALVLCGDRSAGRGTGALPAFLAHELGAAQALGLVSVTADGDRLHAERRLPGGRRERLRVTMPAVCSVEAAGVRLRRAGLAAVLAAGQAVIPVVTVPIPRSRIQAGPPRPYRPRVHAVPEIPAGPARARLLALTGVHARREPPAVIGPAGPGAAAGELLGYLRRHGYGPAAAGAAAGPPPAAGGA
jgi:electron transfer flavoprotein beta subunit